MNTEKIICSIVKKAFEQPETGIFYLVPDPDTKKFTIWSSYDSETSTENLHIDLWEKIIIKLRFRFKKSDVESLSNNYQGLPRGRVTTSADGWIVAYGNDFLLAEYKSDILSEFKLHDAFSIGKVRFETDPHEKMDLQEKKETERILKIKLTPNGFSLSKG